MSFSPGLFFARSWAGIIECLGLAVVAWAGDPIAEGRLQWTWKNCLFVLASFLRI